jgi:hypothetical protein
MKTRNNLPFSFIFDHLFPLEVTVKPMFGMFAIYIGSKIMLMLRQRNDHSEINGVWVATSREYDDSLKRDIPSLCPISGLTADQTDTQWQMVPSKADSFETDILELCRLIVKGDPRIGRIPKPGKKKR